MFDVGLLDHIKNFQGILEKLYIAHRKHEDFADNQTKQRERDNVVREMAELINQMPSMRLVLLSPSGRAAFHRFSTWTLALVNGIDEPNSTISRGTYDLLQILPELFLDIPFELFRVFKRSNLTLNAI